jgi:hypothetical protein
VPRARQGRKSNISLFEQDEEQRLTFKQVVIPVDALNLPWGHCSQTVAPITAEKEPAGHDTHVELLLAPTAAEYVPDGHNMQLVVP